MTDAIEDHEDAVDGNLKQLTDPEKFKKMYEMKLQCKLVFYDYIVDQND